MTGKHVRLGALARQIKRLQARIEKAQATSARFSRLRLGIFIAGMSVGIALYYLLSIVAGWLVIGATIAIFNVVAWVHRRIDKSLKASQIWHELKIRQRARMLLDWDDIPAALASETTDAHSFGADLDITGERSLHRLIDSAISMAGSTLLRDWLLQPELDLEVIAARQEVVRELTPLARFRDKLYLAFRLVSRKHLDSHSLLHFLGSRHLPAGFNKVLVSSLVLAAVNVCLLALHWLHGLPAYWMFGLLVYAIIYLWNQKAVDALLIESVFISEELQKLKAVLGYLESYRYGQHQHLRELCRPFWQPSERPSRQLRNTALLGTAVGLRMNPVFRLALNLAVPWDFCLVRLMHGFSKRLHLQLGRWFAALTELEALNSLANFAYLNPGSTLPVITSADGVDVVFQGEGLGHPLIASEMRRCNDFIFEKRGDVVVITGSNMSGKSTFLKTVGVNLCLAFAGGPVIAQSLHTCLLRLFTCIKINDSVTDGFSFFYAEVKRLKQLLQELRADSDLPLIFLIDEIFRGTNNRERLLGSQAYVKALVGQNGLGAISTHDLELTNLAKTIPQVSNFHFREEVEGGKMVFDYKMRPGPCPSTNALKIMQMEGLPVEFTPEAD